MAKKVSSTAPMYGADEVFPTIFIVYKGLRNGTFDNEPYHLFEVYDSEGKQLEDMQFNNMPGKSAEIVGAKFQCQKTPTGVRGPYTITDYVKGDEVAAWRNQSYAAKRLNEARKGAEKKRTGLEDELESLRQKYRDIPASQRSIWIATLVYNITK